VSAAAPVNVALRPARLADAPAIHGWNFAPDVRAQSGDPRVVDLRDHTAWLGAPPRGQRGPDLGHHRWRRGRRHGAHRRAGRRRGRRDHLDRARAIGARGRGIGTSAITAAVATFGRAVQAAIVSTNLGSQRAFLAAGFVPAGERALPDARRLLLFRWSPA
jgi:RimJ/RimL family protein N-acetyltransferase